MKKENLLTGLVVAISLASPMVSAQADYPAAFEPQVLYRDADLIAKHANRQPQAPASQSVATSAAAPKQSVSAPSVSSASSSVSSSASTSGGESGGSSNMPIILAGLAVAGAAFWFTRRPSGVAAGGQASAGFTPAVVPAGTTGVAQYVESLGSGGVETGVSKYVKSLPAIALPQTGVAKYLRNLPFPEVAGPVETGVAKYLKGLPKPPVLPTDETGVTKYLKSL